MAFFNSLMVSLSTGIPGFVVGGLTLTLILLALIRRDTLMMIAAAFLLVPMAYTLGTWSGLFMVVRLMPLFPLLSAVAISREDSLLAWLLPLPSVGYLIYYLFRLVASDFRGV